MAVGFNFPQIRELVLGSDTVKRSVLPSGDQRGHAGTPVTLVTLWGSDPSLLATYRSEPAT
jgi:hypothetical protein